jgi:hypothetical protein
METTSFTMEFLEQELLKQLMSTARKIICRVRLNVDRVEGGIFRRKKQQNHSIVVEKKANRISIASLNTIPLICHDYFVPPGLHPH